MAATLLRTKLYIPPIRSSLIGRCRLLAVLDHGLTQGSHFTLISAPAGYGKSVIAAEWLRSLQNTKSRSTQVFWLSLDEKDNNLVRFLTYLAASLQIDETETWLHVQGMLRAPQLPPIDTLMTSLINGVSQVWLDSNSDGERSDCVVLVLDDYHKINHPLIHDTIQFLLEFSPPQLHLVLVTREDPPLPLSRMRVQNEMTEIRAKDLRFTEEETNEFIHQVSGLTLHPDWINTLANRTEGWIAGLQLVALSIGEHADISVFMENFRGSHRYLLDYLMDEVLLLQTEERRQFLCRTSVLERFNASLCNVLTGREDSQNMLAEIEQLNLFLIPLDEHREWYRYHHLFADCLRTQLDKEEQIVFRKKAAEWFETNKDITEAVQYALATGDCDYAAATIERGLNLPQAWSGGQLTVLEEWLAALPEVCLRSRPLLQISASRIFFLAGKLEQSSILLAQAEETLQTAIVENSHYALAQIGIYKGAILATQGQVTQAREIVTRAMGELPSDDLHAQARAFDTLGLICERAGD